MGEPRGGGEAGGGGGGGRQVWAGVQGGGGAWGQQAHSLIGVVFVGCGPWGLSVPPAGRRQAVPTQIIGRLSDTLPLPCRPPAHLRYPWAVGWVQSAAAEGAGKGAVQLPTGRAGVLITQACVRETSLKEVQRLPKQLEPRLAPQQPSRCSPQGARSGDPLLSASLPSLVAPPSARVDTADRHALALPSPLLQAARVRQLGAWLQPEAR